MFSVIIPTIWKINFHRSINLLNSSDLVSEIILVNNDKKNTPDWWSDVDKDKITEVTPPKNLYVNPSWNLGCKIASSENVIFYSDDIEVDTNEYLSVISEKLKTENCLIGCNEESFKTENTSSIEIIRESGNRPFSYGAFLALRKSSYIPIPDNFKIWFGDDFLFHYFNRKFNSSYSIKNIGMKNSKMEVSSSSLKHICLKDRDQNFDRELETYITTG